MPSGDKKPEASKDVPKKGDKAGKDAAETAKKAAPAPPPTPKEVLHRNVGLIDKYVDSRDSRFLLKVLRYSNFLRGHLPVSELKAVMASQVPDKARLAQLNEIADAVLAKRPEPPASRAPAAAAAAKAKAEAGAGASSEMAVDDSSSAGAAAGSDAAAAAPGAPKRGTGLPKPNPASALEVETYFHVLLLSMLVAARDWAGVERAALPLIDALTAANRRTCDLFSARAYAYLSLAVERSGSSAEALRDVLTAAHRTATLRHDEYGQAVLLNLLLRSLLRQRRFEQAGKLIARAAFPEAASNAQLVRFLYYRGRVQAVALHYAESYASLMQALRKAPPAAVAFRTAVQAAAVTVQLLMGEIPEASVFGKEGGLPRAALLPYRTITQAVRAGDLARFSAALAEHAPAFERDGNLTLVTRLQGSVIKAGLRAIATSYSRIAFTDIAAKLSLPSAEDAEMLCAKAIRDGVVDGALDHEGGALVSREASNVYATREPQEAFHKRIRFCLDVHVEAVRGMRYPPRAVKEDLLSAEERAERERDEAELADDLEEGGFDEDD